MNTKHIKIQIMSLMMLTIFLGALSSSSLASDWMEEAPIRLGEGQVASIAFSPDGTILFVAQRTDSSGFSNQAQTIIYWDPQTQEQVASLPKHLVSTMTLSPDGTILASAADSQRTIHLWDVAGQNKVGTIQSPHGIDYLAFSPDGGILASSGFYDNSVHLWDVQSHEQIGELPVSGRGGRPLAFTPDGELFVVGGHREGNKDLRLWDIEIQKQVGELVGHLDGIYDLAFSPDGLILASAGGWDDKAVFMWDVQTRNQIGILGGHPAHVGSVAFSPDGTLLASTSYWDDTIHIWDVSSQEEIGLIAGHDASDIGLNDKVVFSPDGKWLACGGDNGVELWEANLPGAAPRTSAFGPQPRDSNIHYDTWTILTWRSGDYAASHDVYLADSFDDVNDGTVDAYRGNQTDNTLLVGFQGYLFPEGLVPGSTYYWRIDEVNDADPNSPWKGPVWSFSIAPKTAYSPNPADGAESVETDVVLGWEAGFGAILHTIYFSDNFDDVVTSIEGIPQSKTTYTPGTLDLGRTYYWRVDEFDGYETHKSDIWSFTTINSGANQN